jgi:hypothetical protein
MQLPKEEKMIEPLRLTRYLYIYDEAVYSLITALLLRKDIYTCYYLICEIYATEPTQIFEILWKIYFDFYAERHPTLETCLANKHRVWIESPHIRPVIFIVKNMFSLQGDPTVFHLRQFVENGGKCLCIYRLHKKTLEKRGWRGYHKLVCRLFVAMEKGHIQNAGCYIAKLLETITSEEVYFMMIDYFSGYISLKNMTTIRSRWERRMWVDDKHMLLSFMVSMLEPLQNIVKRITFKPPSELEMKYIAKISTVYGIPAYRILREKRLDVLCPEITSFKLDRYRYMAPSHVIGCDIRDNWEYYAAQTTFWKNRFTCFGGRVNTQSIIFDNEDDEDRFYTKYGLEPDEQPLNIQKMGYTHDEKCGWRTWYEKVFDMEPRVILSEDFSYIW